MPGLEYLESRDPLEDNYYRSGLLSIGLEVGVLGFGAVGLKKLHKGAVRDTKTARANTKEYYNTFRGFKSPQDAYNEAKKLSGISAVKDKAKTYKDTARTFSKLTKLTGLMGMFTLGYDVSRALAGTSQMFLESKRDLENSRRKPIYNGEESFFDSRAAFTQRQRAIQVIHNSQMSTRAAMGSESSFMHY